MAGIDLPVHTIRRQIATAIQVVVHIARLREKLRDNSGEPRVLLTVRGKGYMFAKQDA